MKFSTKSAIIAVALTAFAYTAFVGCGKSQEPSGDPHGTGLLSQTTSTGTNQAVQSSGMSADELAQAYKDNPQYKQTWDMQCHPEDKNQLASLNKGQTVTIQGLVQGMLAFDTIDGTVVLDDCVISQ